MTSLSFTADLNQVNNFYETPYVSLPNIRYASIKIITNGEVKLTQYHSMDKVHITEELVNYVNGNEVIDVQLSARFLKFRIELEANNVLCQVATSFHDNAPLIESMVSGQCVTLFTPDVVTNVSDVINIGFRYYHFIIYGTIKEFTYIHVETSPNNEDWFNVETYHHTADYDNDVQIKFKLPAKYIRVVLSETVQAKLYLNMSK